AGTTTIRAQFGGVFGSTGLTVTTATLTALVVSPPTATLAKGSFLQMAATAQFSDGSTLDVTTQVSWKSSNKKSVSVNATGRAMGVKAGVGVVTASKSGVSGTSTITVP